METKAKTSTEKSEAEQSQCPLRYLLEEFGGKWKLPIVCMLSSGEPIRFNTLRRKLEDITNMMLSRSLKELESSGLIHRKQYHEIPPRVEYTLSEKGESFLPVLHEAAHWAMDNMQEDEAVVLRCEECRATT